MTNGVTPRVAVLPAAPTEQNDVTLAVQDQRIAGILITAAHPITFAIHAACSVPQVPFWDA